MTAIRRTTIHSREKSFAFRPNSNPTCELNKSTVLVFLEECRVFVHGIGGVWAAVFSLEALHSENIVSDFDMVALINIFIYIYINV